MDTFELSCGTIPLFWDALARLGNFSMSLLAEERRFRIREILSRERSVTASELIRTLGVTAATIRRDLAVLEKEGVLERSHGGAVSRTSSTNFQPSYEALGRSNRAEKQAIAREAERLILDGETIFLEASTSVFELARRLLRRNRLNVITNSPPIVDELQRSQHVSVISTGGELQKDVFYLSGALGAARAFRNSRGQGGAGCSGDRSRVWDFHGQSGGSSDQKNDFEIGASEHCAWRITASSEIRDSPTSGQLRISTFWSRIP